MTDTWVIFTTNASICPNLKMGIYVYVSSVYVVIARFSPYMLYMADVILYQFTISVSSQYRH